MHWSCLWLKINLAKLELILVGVVKDVGGLARILGCRVSSLPIEYLGLPLGASFKDKFIWDSNIEKMECRLAGWKMLYLSKGDKISLIESTHSSLLLFIFWLIIYVFIKKRKALLST